MPGHQSLTPARLTRSQSKDSNTVEYPLLGRRSDTSPAEVKSRTQSKRKTASYADGPKQRPPTAGSTNHSPSKRQRGYDPYRAPTPDLSYLTPTLTEDSSSGHDAEFLLFTRAFHLATKFKANMPYFQAEDLDVNVLAAEKTKNKPSVIAELKAKIDDDLSKRDAQAFTGGFVDKTGAVLMYYISNTAESPTKPAKTPKPLAPTSTQLPPLPEHFPARPPSYYPPYQPQSSRGANNRPDQAKTRSSIVAEQARHYFYGSGYTAIDEDFDDMNEYALETKIRPLSEQYRDRTVRDLEKAKQSGMTVHRDGFLPDFLRRTLEASQYLHAKCPFKPPKSDIRHLPRDEENIHLMKYPTAMLNDVPLPTFATSKHKHTGPTTRSQLRVSKDVADAQYDAVHLNKRQGLARGGMKTMGQQAEKTSTNHLIHLWPMKGHPNDEHYYHSTDMGRTVSERQTVAWYFQATRDIAIILAAYFAVLYPKYYKKYKAAFDAGVWIREDPGPFLGRVIVWKLQVSLHQDRSDAGPTATFPNGMYKGGEFYVPELDVKLAYQPGDIVIGFTGWLYHTVGPWEPNPVPESYVMDNLTPGRVSHVFFFPKCSYDFLQGKPPGWSINTAGGSLPNACQRASSSSSS